MTPVQQKNRPIGFVRVFAALFGLVSAPVVLATGITGSYTGTYSSFSNGGDSGTVTITVDSYGVVGCDFYSTAKKAHYTARGSANASPSGTSVSFGSPGQPMGPAIALTGTSINCVNGPRINSGGPPSNGSDPVSLSTFFAAQIVFFWAPSVGVVSYQAGTWVSASGDAGQFSIGLQPSIDTTAAINPLALTGLWYDPNYTGSGFNIMGATLGLIVTYYGWDKAGKRLWLTSAIGPSQILLGQSITLNLTQTMDGTYSTPAPPSTNSPWGTLTLTFTTCTTANATLNGSDGNLTESLTLLAGLSSIGCQ
jgi:hypothetical protein